MDVKNITRVIRVKRGESFGAGPYKATAGSDGFMFWRTGSVQPIFHSLSNGDLELKVLMSSIRRNAKKLKKYIKGSSHNRNIV